VNEDLGMKARHAIITPTCRENRTDGGAWGEACDRLKDSYRQCLSGWRMDGKEPTFHLVLYVERPEVQPAAGDQTTDGGRA